MKKQNLKAQNEKAHFNKRCIERVGETLNRKEIERSIRSGKLQFYDRQSNRITRYIYTHNDIDYIVVYDKQRHKAVTILYADKERKNG